MDEGWLLDLSEHRWSMPILALLDRQQGARFSVMLSALAIPRSSLAAALELLIGQGLVCRNPGYGHPLRPEYLLTAAGTAVAGRCRQIMEARDSLGLGPLGRWDLPVVNRLGREGASFTVLQRALLPVTPRALQLCLGGLQRQALIERAGPPRRPSYRLEARGRQLFDSLAG